jgi:hypothetical protein
MDPRRACPYTAGMKWHYPLALGLALASVGCTVGSGAPAAPVPGSGDEILDQEYPVEEIGSAVGMVIKNYQFESYVNPASGVGQDAQTLLSMGDFYNPSGEGLYGDEAPFEVGTKKPRALVINAGAVWCGPCKEEAANELPKHFGELAPKGMQLLFILFDSKKPGEPATFSDLDNWTSTFNVNYPAGIDPKRNMADIGDPSQFPFNVIIDTRTMRIVEFVTGIPPASFWEQVEKVVGSE